jgi:hypothetical protein
LLYNFDAEINLLEGKMKWSVVYFPHSVIDVFGTNGKVPVAITVDGHKFDHTLLPSRNGHYIVYNKIISQKVGKKRGESVQITLRKLEGKRKVEIPDYVKEKLMETNTLDAFIKQPDYIKREQVNHIVMAKKEETRQTRTEKLVGQLQKDLGV